MLTAKQEQLIEATAPLVAEHLDTITQRFYPLMFERYPEIKPLFNQAHQADGGQPRVLAGAVLAYVQLRKEPEKVKATLATVVEKHVSLNIRPDQYPIVGECLLAAVAEVLGDAVTPEIADAWGALYEELAGLLTELEAKRYHEFAKRPGGWQGERAFRIVEKTPESSVITSFVLAPEDGGTVADFEPGQFIGVHLVIDGESTYRHYSLSGFPNGKTYRLSIKRELQGKASRHLHDTLRVGDTLNLLPPAGELVLDESDAPVMLISGGVGQTPMLPLAQHALEQGRQVVYLHAAQEQDQHAFGDELQALEQRYPRQLTSVTLYERGMEDATEVHIGWIDRELLARYLPEEQAQCYFVGPQGFMTAVNDALAALNVPQEHRHYEHFGPSQPLSAA
ncbi:NO-inducible flavohemoprotein [Pistricoccus aurantiacus]|uniref:nitric oxide dioxygenase n=1 Tax=Pistricoccus aurantiacus TaxID=1883414 RepID=A0A5B8STP2_9GAMM|nr:NO-inducible flavohemoprotein [Pistricoccus aurantiacus]QEA40542.1 NO-inducible flavohemoprotein [Pistricoccus aurantiacus]